MTTKEELKEYSFPRSNEISLQHCGCYNKKTSRALKRNITKKVDEQLC